MKSLNVNTSLGNNPIPIMLERGGADLSANDLGKNTFQPSIIKQLNFLTIYKYK